MKFFYLFKKEWLFIIFIINWAGNAAKAEDLKFFSLDNFSSSLLLKYQITDEQERSMNSIYRDLNRKFFEGGIHLNTEGSIYHPNFLTFKADLNIIGYNSKYTLFSDSSVNNAINNNYELNLLFLKKKKINFELFSLSKFSTSDRIFLDRYYTTWKSTGLKLFIKTKILPFELDIYNSQIKSESLTYSERNEKTKNIDFKLTLFSGSKTRSILTIRNKDYSESVFSVNYQSLGLMANFDHRFGAKSSNFFSSILAYNRMSGDYDLNILNFRNSFVYYIFPTMHFNAVYALNFDNSYNRYFRRHDISGSVQHQLYESLLSTLLVGGRFEESAYRKVNAFQHLYSFSYKKKFPLGNISLFFINRNEKGNYTSLQPITETSEHHDFSISDTIVISRQGINPSSIKLTDPNINMIYIQGIDFHVEARDNLITITRLPGGAIPERAKVLVIFEYLSYPDFHLNTHFYQLNTFVNFLKYFYVFFYKTVNNPVLDSLYTIHPFEDYGKNTIGARIITKFSNIDYSHEKYDSNLSSYISKNLRLSAKVGLSRMLQLSGNLVMNRMDYEPQLFYTRFDAFSLNCSLNPHPKFKVNTIYRQIRYSTNRYFRDRQSMLVKISWNFRKIILYAFYEHLFSGADTVERGHNFFSIMVRRIF